MLRITELRLPLDHPKEDLRKSVLARLGVPSDDLLSFSVFRRAWDARKKSAIKLVYTVDAEVRDEARVLARLKDDRHVNPAPDTTYKFVAHAPERIAKRPVVIGTGPCGFMCALVLADHLLRQGSLR